MLPMTILILTRVQGKYPQNVATYQMFLSQDSKFVMRILRSERFLQGLWLPTPILLKAYYLTLADRDLGAWGSLF